MAIDREKVMEAAQALVDKRRFDKAIVEYQKLVAADPKDARSLLKIAEVYVRMEQFEPAVTTFERVAQLYASQGFLLKAVASYKQAREIVQKHLSHMGERFAYILPQIAELYVQLKLTSEAVVTYEEALARLEAAGRDRDAIDLMKKIVELDPQSPERAHRLAETLARVGDVEAAAAQYSAAAEALLAQGRRDDALSVAESSLRVRFDPKVARLAAQIYLDRGYPQDGAAAFLKIQLCYRQAPKDLDTLELLAKALYVLRQPDKALDVHKEAARIARDVGDMDVFDRQMETLVARAPNEAGVRRLAALWSKAPQAMRESQPHSRPSSTGLASPSPDLPPPPASSPRTPPSLQRLAVPPPPASSPRTPPPLHRPPPSSHPASPPRLPRLPMPPPPPSQQRATPTPQQRLTPPPTPRPVERAAPASPPVEPEGFPIELEPSVSDGAGLPFSAPEPPQAPAVPEVVPLLPSDDNPSSFVGRGGFDEDAIEEVEFFVSQGMYEDALGILEEQLVRLPNHPLLLDRKQEIEALMAGEPAER